MKKFLCGLVLAFFSLAACAAPQRVALQTSAGTVVLELYPDQAPASVANFLAYAKSGFYDNTVFHRVIDGFMVQGGGFTVDMQQKPTRAPIKNEADNGLKNLAGTVAMARTSDPDSATAQFFINLVDNDFLDYRAPTRQGWGYAVFGKVVEGMDVMRRIARLPTTDIGPFQNVPRTPVLIRSVQLIESQP